MLHFRGSSHVSCMAAAWRMSKPLLLKNGKRGTACQEPGSATSRSIVSEGVSFAFTAKGSSAQLQQPSSALSFSHSFDIPTVKPNLDFLTGAYRK